MNVHISGGANIVSSNPTCQTLVVESNPLLVSNLWNVILADLKDKNFSKDDCFSIHLALEEAFINAVKHGNKMDIDKKIELSYQIDDEKITLSITDQGQGFSPEAVPDPRCGENIFKPSGRGLLLIRSYMDKAEHSKNGTSLTMVKYKTSEESDQ